METVTGNINKHRREHETKIRCRRPITLPVYGTITVDTEVHGKKTQLRFGAKETAQIRDGLSGDYAIRTRAKEYIKNGLRLEDEADRNVEFARAHGMIMAIRLNRDFGYDKMGGHKEDVELWDEVYAEAEEEVARMRSIPPSFNR